jgi:TolB-like 6-blade propeller-like
MRSINIILIVVYCIIFFTCSSDNKKSQVKDPNALFTITKKLLANELNISGQILHTYSLTVIDSLIVIEDRSKGYYFNLFNLYSGAYVCSFAKLGDGPCEFQFPTSIQLVPNRERAIGLFNRKTFKYTTVSIDSLLKKTVLVCEGMTEAFDVNFQKVIQLNDSTFSGLGHFKRRYVLANHKGDTTGTFYHYPFQEQLQAGYSVLAMAYQGDILPHPRGTAFVSTSRYCANFDIVDFEKGKFTNIKENRFWPPIFTGTDGQVIGATMNPDNVNGFIDLAVTEKYIYLLFSGKKDSDKNWVQSSTVMVFDWSGQPFVKYDLGIEVEVITVDKNDKMLYAYHDDSKAHLLKFSIR